MPSAGKLFGAALLNALGKGVKGYGEGRTSYRDYALKALDVAREREDKRQDRALKTKQLEQTGEYQKNIIGMQNKRLEEQYKDRDVLDTYGPKVEEARAKVTDPATGNLIGTPDYVSVGLTPEQVTKYNNAKQRSFFAKQKAQDENDALTMLANSLGMTNTQ